MDADPELVAIFKSELPGDIEYLMNADSERDFEAVYQFAHKYKVRLHYLGKQVSHDLCLQIESAYKQSELKDLKNLTSKLIERLESIANE